MQLGLEGARQCSHLPMAPQKAHKQRELFPPAPAPGKTGRFDAFAPFPRRPGRSQTRNAGGLRRARTQQPDGGLVGSEHPTGLLGTLWGEILYPDPQEGPRGGCGQKRWRRRAARSRSPPGCRG